VIEYKEIKEKANKYKIIFYLTVFISILIFIFLIWLSFLYSYGYCVLYGFIYPFFLLFLYAILQNNFIVYLKNGALHNIFKELKKEGYLNKIFEDFNIDNQEFDVKYYPKFFSKADAFGSDIIYADSNYREYFSELFHIINQLYNVIFEKIHYYKIKNQIDNGYKLYSIIKNTSDFMILRLNKEVKILDIEILLYYGNYKSNYEKNRYLKPKVFNGIILEFDLSVQNNLDIFVFYDKNIEAHKDLYKDKGYHFYNDFILIYPESYKNDKVIQSVVSNLINSYYEQKKFFNSFFVLQGNKLYNFLSYDDLGINLREVDFYNFLDFLVINDSKIKELHLKYKEKIKRILDLFN
jgi:hypothetical protein